MRKWLGKVYVRNKTQELLTSRGFKVSDRNIVLLIDVVFEAMTLALREEGQLTIAEIGTLAVVRNHLARSNSRVYRIKYKATRKVLALLEAIEKDVLDGRNITNLCT
jgi:hypothetical protein